MTDDPTIHNETILQALGELTAGATLLKAGRSVCCSIDMVAATCM